ncbi:MAG: ATP-binding cassette domain-containing protein [Clostridia bacterium]|nr:ATP-binding cassette domain-containing protein [Clostridia bacterium]
MTLPSKGLVFLLGESGAGKSTMLNLLGGIERADGGEIYVDGLNIVKSTDIELDRYRNTDVGFIFQDFNLLTNFNVAENVRLAQDLQSKEECGSKVDDALTAVKMSEYANRKINELSGGQKQRVAIARAIVKNPKIILADEPTGALDAKTGRTILELLKEISKDSLVLVVSHDEVFANSYADRIIRIENGKVIEDKTISEDAENVAQDSQVASAPNSNAKKKYSLSPKTAVKMAAYSLGSKKIRLAMTLILCIVCFAVFGIADTLAAWNCEKTTYDAIISSDDKYIVNWTNEGSHLVDDFTKVYKESGYRFKIQEYYLPIKDTEYSYGCYHRYADGYVEIGDKTMQELDAKLYAGRYPQEQGEVAISYHIYRGFKAGAYKANDLYIDGSLLEATDGENGIFGKKVSVSNCNFTIVGIIDTGYDYEKNSKIDPLSDNYDKNNSNSIDDNNDGHSILFLPKGGIEYINSLMQTSEYIYGAPTYSGFSFENQIINDISQPGRMFYTSDLETFQKSNTRILWLGEEKNSLADNEAIISYGVIGSILDIITYVPGTSGNIGRGINLTYVNFSSNRLILTTEKFTKIDYKFFKAYSNAQIYSYAMQNATLYQDDENVKMIADKYTTDGNLAMAVAYFLSSRGINSEIKTGYLNNPYGKSGFEIIAESNMEFLEQYNLVNQFDEISIRLSSGKGQISAKIVGIYIPSDATGMAIYEKYGTYFEEEKSRALINPAAYQIDKANLESKHLDANLGIIRIAPENQQKIKNGISQYLYNKENLMIFTNSEVLKQAGYMKSTMDIMKKIFYYVSLGIGIFAAIMLGNYLINSIMARKKEIGILRAIGATSRDIFHICLFEGMILFAIIFAVSTILSGVAGAIINSTIKSNLNILIPISVFGIRQVALIFAVSLAVTLVVSLIGSYVVSKRKPIEVIR